MTASYITKEELVSELGEEASEAIMKRIGGLRIYVPRQAEEGSRLVGLLGSELATKLCNMVAVGIGGMDVELPFPMGEKFHRQQWFLEVCSDMTRSEAEIAQELGIHGRSVRRYRARARQRAISSGAGQVSGARSI